MNAPLVSTSLPRVRARVACAFARAGARTEAAETFETGGWRLRFPRARERCEAVIVNTGGGMAGGDKVELEISAREGASGLATSQSQEKIYRAGGAACEIRTRLDVAAKAELVWAPQETLLFEGARLERRLEADVAETGALTIFEAVAFGRLAHGEVSIDAALADRWRVRRGGRLVFAEALRIENAGATLDRVAVGAGARALATVVRVAPDAAGALDGLRAALEAVEAAEGARVEAGASVVDGVLVARLASPSPQRLRAGLIAAFRALEGREPPRVWF